eukprot:COSAG03_NODE_9847_length_690_cov_1.049069_1_plen_44_part_10
MAYTRSSMQNYGYNARKAALTFRTKQPNSFVSLSSAASSFSVGS